MRACVCVCMCVHFHILLYVNCFGWTVLCMCIEYCIKVNMYEVSNQGVDVFNLKALNQPCISVAFL